MKVEEEERVRGPATVGDHVREYCSCTSIHGVQYLVGRPNSERLWWVVVFVISFLGNSYLIRQVWLKWNESPVIVTFSERAVPVWDIPFPAVTICPRIKYRASDYPNLREYMVTDYSEDNEMDEETLKQGNDLTLLCKGNVVAFNGSLFADDNITLFFEEVGPMLMENSMVKWNREVFEDENVTSVMTRTVTADGICNSFNLLGYHDLFRNSDVLGYDKGKSSQGWSLEGGYPEDLPLDSYPERAKDYGISAGLAVWLYSDKQDFDYECAGLTPGFKIILHNPAEVPNSKGKYFLLESDQQAMVAIEPEIIKTTESLRSYTPESRQCYFSQERYLEYFRIYTQQNCEMECLTNYTYNLCHCIGFYMPKKEGEKKIPLCGPGNKECLITAKKEMMEKERRLRKHGKGGCHCLPSCADVKYKLDVTQTSYDWKKAEREVPVEQRNYAVSKMVIYFPDKQFISQQRSELYGLVDFLANCGGLIGLFSGFSVLSIVEIFYFLTLRGYNNLLRQNRRKKRSPSRGNI